MLLDRVRRWWRRQPAPAPCPAPALTVVAAPTPVRPEPVARTAPPAVVPMPVTPRARAPRWEPRRLPPALAARRLLHWCQTEGGATGSFLAADLLEIYHEQCAYDGLEPLSWQTVATALRPLTGGKTYRWVVRDDGRHRLRIYHVPPLPKGRDARFLELEPWLAREAAPAPARLRRAA